MMRPILLFGLAGLLALPTYSQDYIPLLQEGNYWQVGQWEGTAICTLVSAQRLNLMGDSVIDSQVYSKFTAQSVYAVDGGPFCWPYATSPLEYETDILLREDIANKKVYQRIDDEDYLLYDFSLDVGDVFDVEIAGEFIFQVEVTDTYVEEYSGEERRFIIASLFDDVEFTIVEGIGSMHGIVTPFEEAIGSGSSLMCYGNTITQIEDATCAPIVTSTYELTSSVHFEIYPNPSPRYVNIAVEGLSAGTVRILNLTGKVVETQQILGGFSTSLEHHLRFDTTDIPQGIYFVTLETEQGIAVKKVVVN